MLEAYNCRIMSVLGSPRGHPVLGSLGGLILPVGDWEDRVLLADGAEFGVAERSLAEVVQHLGLLVETRALAYPAASGALAHYVDDPGGRGGVVGLGDQPD